MLTEQQLMKDVKIKLQELKDEDLKLMLSTKKQITFLNEEVSALKRERAKYEDMIFKQKKQNDKVLDSFMKYQAWMDDKVLAMNTGFLQLQGETLGMTVHVKKDYELASAKFKELEKEVQNKMLANDKKYQILELYLSERQYNKLKMIELQDKFSQYAPLQKIDFLRLCQVKELQMNKSEINTILHTYLPPAIKEMLPQIEKKVKDIDFITEQVKDLQGYMFSSEQEMNSFKNTTQSLQSNIKKDMKQFSGTFLSNIETLKTDVKVALAMDQKQTQQRKKFEKDLSTKIQTFVKEENEQIFERIQVQTLRMLERNKKQDESKIQEHHQLMQRRCEQVRVTSGNIEKLLGSYNSRIVKIRSDTELFKNQMMKEMKTLASIKQQSQQKFQDFGKIIASMVEIIQTNLSIQMNLDEQSLRNDNFAFATNNDGIIYQVVPMYSKEGDNKNSNQITYRRNKLEIPHLRRSLLTSVVNLIDRIYESYPYLQWKNYRPSNFFKEEILSNYFVQVEKYGEGNYINNNNNSSKNNNHNNHSNHNNNYNSNNNYNYNNYTHNRNETEVLNKSSSAYKNLEHSSSISKNIDRSSTVFKRNKISDLAYSPSKKQELISATIDSQLVPKYNDNFQTGFQRLGKTIDEGIQFNNSKDNRFNLGERDKKAIRRAMRTLHQVQPRDSNNNTTAMTISNQACSFIKEDQRTLDPIPQTAGGQRKKFINKSKKQLGQSQSRYKSNDTETFMTSRSTRRAISIANYKIE